MKKKDCGDIALSFDEILYAELLQAHEKVADCPESEKNFWLGYHEGLSKAYKMFSNHFNEELPS